MYGIDIGALRWGIGIFVFFIIAWIILAKHLLKSESKPIKVNMADRYDDISSEELAKIGIDLNKFKLIVYEKFRDIHEALTNYDFEVLKKNLTMDLYQYYIEQLEILRKLKHRNVMSDIELLNVKVCKISNEHDMLRIDVYLNVRMLDYVIDVDTGKCVKGSNSDKIDYEFELWFEKRGSGSIINNQFVMSKKTCINDMEVEKTNNKKIF